MCRRSGVRSPPENLRLVWRGSETWLSGNYSNFYFMKIYPNKDDFNFVFLCFQPEDLLGFKCPNPKLSIEDAISQRVHLRFGDHDRCDSEFFISNMHLLLTMSVKIRMERNLRLKEKFLTSQKRHSYLSFYSCICHYLIYGHVQVCWSQGLSLLLHVSAHRSSEAGWLRAGTGRKPVLWPSMTWQVISPFYGELAAGREGSKPVLWRASCRHGR